MTEQPILNPLWRALPASILLLCCILVSFSIRATTTYYINPQKGNDNFSGQSIHTPWRTLSAINQVSLSPGDRVLLAAGQTHHGELRLINTHGELSNPIEVSSYPGLAQAPSSRAVIDARGLSQAVLLKNSRHIRISDLQIHANGGAGETQDENPMRVGVLVLATQKGEYGDISLHNLHIHDVFWHEQGIDRGADEVKSANGTQAYGWGIRVINRHPGASIRDVTVRANQIDNVAHTGIKFTGNQGGIFDVEVSDNVVNRVGGPGIQASNVYDASFRSNRVDRSGSADDSRKWGRGSGLWVWGSERVLIERNSFSNANGPADSAGVHIDFNCRDIIVQSNLSRDNAGAFYEVLGNNYNTAYRYNVSINDGHRVKGQNGAFQEGKVFWLSGYQGRKKQQKGPFNSYFYNNTIYVRDDILAKFALTNTAEGILIANNIFYIKGNSQHVRGDQYNPQEAGFAIPESLIFTNNLYLSEHNWPGNMPIQDSMPLFGDPGFVNPGGQTLSDYRPQNAVLVQNRGILIKVLPGDKSGLFLGLKVERDILGSLVDGLPDIGAIEIVDTGKHAGAAR